MAKTLVLIGRIGPAFNGTHIESHGSASSRGIDIHTTDVCFASMEGNLFQANEYVEYQTDYEPRFEFEGAIILHDDGSLTLSGTGEII